MDPNRNQSANLTEIIQKGKTKNAWLILGTKGVFGECFQTTIFSF